MKHYIYKITCLCGDYAGRYYLGMHSTNDINDNYAGSGTKIIEYYHKYGKVLNKTYKKDILFYADSRENLKLMEKAIIGNNYYSAPLCLNKVPGGNGTLSAWNKGAKTKPEVVEKLKISHKGQTAWNKGMKNQYTTKSHKMTAIGRKNVSDAVLLKWQDPEYRNKCSAAKKGKHRVYDNLEHTRWHFE